MQNIPDNGDNIIKAAAYLHCKFENAHPFADGNGRVGRTLMNYFLMINNYPPIVVRNQSKDKYYKALEIYDKTGELDPFVSYIKKEAEIPSRVIGLQLPKALIAFSYNKNIPL